MSNIEQLSFLGAPAVATDYIWRLSDGYTKSNGLKVFSCFSCGGGSTMGYKLAGCEVVGNVEIDPKINEIYKANHKPKYSYCMDIRAFNNIPNEELPCELFELDILDGSPPCSSFSMSGIRERAWGVNKVFHEGQTAQILDELPFVFLDTVKKLMPKFVIMENVTGLLYGNAFSYVQRIYKRFYELGYTVRHLILKGETMGVPQARHRVIFIATRLNIDLNTIDLHFKYRPITYGEYMSKKGIPIPANTELARIAQFIRPGDRDLGRTYQRIGEKERSFDQRIVFPNELMPTITTRRMPIRGHEFCYVSKNDIITASTFPQDYNFINKTFSNILFICGMSVPPIMIKRVVERLKVIL